jgi:hypothetical protein
LAVSQQSIHRSSNSERNGEQMSVVAYLVVTVAVFVFLGFTQKLLDRL